MLRTPGTMFTQAASRFSTTLRAIRSASSAEAHVLITAILSVMVVFFAIPLDLLTKEDYKQSKGAHCRNEQNSSPYRIRRRPCAGRSLRLFHSSRTARHPRCARQVARDSPSGRGERQSAAAE